MKLKKISQQNKKHSKQKEIGFKCCTFTCILGHRKTKITKFSWHSEGECVSVKSFRETS